VQPLDESLREAAWTRRGLAYNEKAALAAFARHHGLGSPLTGEFDVSWQGKTYRAQGFTGAIVYAEFGDWSNVRRVSW